MILLTGATGFLGHNLIPELLAAGYRIRVLARPTSDISFLAPYDVEVAYVGDITDEPAVRAAVRGCTQVVHGAGRFRFWGDLTDFWQTNVEGTATVLRAALAEGVERVVHISTVAVVGKPDSRSVVTETTPCAPQDHYQRTKLAAEQMALAYHREQGLDVVVLRPGAFYGPWGRYAFNRLFFEEPLRGWRIRVDGGHHVTFPVFVSDVSQAIDLAIKRGQPGEVYNVAGRSLSHNELNAVVSDLARIGLWRFDIPSWAVVALARVWTGLSRYTQREPFYPINMVPYVFYDWQVSSEKAERELGFEPTSFPDGARTTLQWYWDSGILHRG